MLATLAEGGVPGSLDRPHVSGYLDAIPTDPWSIAVAHDGVFKVAPLTLFDLPLERFWMWAMDLAAITVVEFRAGRPVLRAHNLTDHLAALLDETAREEQEERSRSGALDRRAGPAGGASSRRPSAGDGGCRRSSWIPQPSMGIADATNRSSASVWPP